MDRPEDNPNESPVRYQASDSGRRIFVPLFLVLSISLSSYLYIFHFASEKIDHQAQAEMQGRVEVALDIETRRLGDLLTEYAFWDVGHRNLIAQPDPKWADENIGAYMADNLSIAYSIAVTGDDRESIAFAEGEQTTGLLPKLMQAGLAQMLPELRADTSEPAPQHAFLAVDDQFLLIAVDTFTPEFDHSPAADGSLLLIARAITPGYIAEIGKLYRIPNLRIADASTVDSDLSHTIAALGADDRLTLTWDELPTAQTLSAHLIWPLAGIFLLMVLTSVWIIRTDIGRRQRQEQILRDLASHDPLTGIYNRREFFQLAQQELSRSDRENSATSLLILDIDHFKQVNDRFGHVAGDQLLINTTRVLASGLRDFDILARYGGEEFVILLPNTGTLHAVEIAERLRKDIDQAKTRFGQETLHVTVSIGITVYSSGEAVRELLARADKALYAAKNAGRNQCHVADMATQAELSFDA